MKLTDGFIVFLALLFWTVVISTAGVIGLDLTDKDAGTIPPLSITCQEDMACWDCTTMGNHRCGVWPTYHTWRRTHA